MYVYMIASWFHHYRLYAIAELIVERCISICNHINTWWMIFCVTASGNSLKMLLFRFVLWLPLQSVTWISATASLLSNHTALQVLSSLSNRYRNFSIFASLVDERPASYYLPTRLERSHLD